MLDAYVAACKQANTEILRLLIKHRRWCIPETFHMRLVYAASLDKPNALRMLISDGKLDVNKRLVNCYPLHMAVIGSKLESVDILLDAGANPNVETNQGLTPLHWLTSGRWQSCSDITKKARKLIKAGADINKRRVNGMTPLDEADPDNLALLLMMLGHGAKLHVPTCSILRVRVAQINTIALVVCALRKNHKIPLEIGALVGRCLYRF
jgi:ankyrin repeat protein